MEKTSQKNKKGGNVPVNRRKKPIFLVSIAIPFIFAPSLIGDAFEFVGSFMTQNSYAEEVSQEKESDSLGHLQNLLEKEGVLYESVKHESVGILSGRIVTAYNAVPEQTAGDPCEGAFTPHTGINFCDTNIPIVATNELPLGTIIKIDDQIFLVADRTNSRYKYRYDILTPTLAEAKEWGRRTHVVEVVGKIVKSKNS
ncbi:MAG: hypothetical protein Q8O83_01920 [bacterium]|nr:hypothetical protein [bacterium]